MNGSMNEIKSILGKRKKYLQTLEREANEQLKKAPKGKLRISVKKGKKQYYQRKEKSEKGGRYIPVKERYVAEGLAQKDYDQKLLCAIRMEMKAIDIFMAKLPEVTGEEVFGMLNEARQELVNPLIETDDSILRRWENVSYTGKILDEQRAFFLTDRGEKVRSKSEMIIANQLAKAGVPYHYEYPLELKRYGTVYPDFTCLNIQKRKVFYWEHQGMMDDENYARKAIRKTVMYQECGIYQGEKLILTSETSSYPINMEQIKDLIGHYLK